jgi:hypothetical protein
VDHLDHPRHHRACRVHPEPRPGRSRRRHLSPLVRAHSATGSSRRVSEPRWNVNKAAPWRVNSRAASSSL